MRPRGFDSPPLRRTPLVVGAVGSATSSRPATDAGCQQAWRDVMYVDLPSPTEVRTFLRVTGTTCVSIYMPATPQQTRGRRSGSVRESGVAGDRAAQGGRRRQARCRQFGESFAELGEDGSLASTRPTAWRCWRLSMRCAPTGSPAIWSLPWSSPTGLHQASAPRGDVSERGFCRALAGSVRLLEFGGDYAPSRSTSPISPRTSTASSRRCQAPQAPPAVGVLSPEG